MAHVTRSLAMGFRNPFRFSFDAETGDLYVGDVGQNDIEEVDVVTAVQLRLEDQGRIVSASNPTGTGRVRHQIKVCAQASLIDPVAQYDHDEGIAILGGFVYRGQAIRALQGRYVFGDYSDPSPGVRSPLLPHSKNIVKMGRQKEHDQGIWTGWSGCPESVCLGFGQDASGELYLSANSTGVPSGTTGVVLKISP